MKNLVPVEYRNQRILTTEQLADSYGTDSDIINKNYNRNKERYIEQKHYYCLENEELRAFKANGQIDLSPNINKLYLWTEKGALLHAKSLNTDIAWQVYDELVENYFSPKQQLDISQLSPQMQLLTQMVNVMATQEVKINQLEAKVQNTEQQTADVKQRLNTVQDTIIQRNDNWRMALNRLFNNAVQSSETKDFKSFRNYTYDILEERAKCDLISRLKNHRKRLLKQGATQTKAKSITRLDIIENDPKLKEIYTTIVKELSINYLARA